MTSDPEFDFWRDVIGDDLVVGGVVYSSAEWLPCSEEGVVRRDHPYADSDHDVPPPTRPTCFDEPPF